MIINVNELCEKSKSTRRLILQMLSHSLSGHPGSSLSIVEITVLLFEYYKIGKNIFSNNQLILSKGHGVPAIYANYIRKGDLPVSYITQLRQGDSPLQGHPDERFLSFLNYSSGSLGINTSVAAGLALGMRNRGSRNKVFLIVGDGELQEGQVWESMMFASHYKLNNLIYIIDYNKLQLDGKVEEIMSLGNLNSKISSFGLLCIEINGHDFNQLNRALSCKSSLPICIIANTIKGKGVRSMEGIIEWHSIHDANIAKKIINEAIKELDLL